MGSGLLEVTLGMLLGFSMKTLLGQASSLSVETAGCFTQWESCFTTAGPLCSASVLLITS